MVFRLQYICSLATCAREQFVPGSSAKTRARWLANRGATCAALGVDAAWLIIKGFLCNILLEDIKELFVVGDMT